MFSKNSLWRVGQISLVAILVALAFSASTAYACGCGIYIPRDGDAQVAQERALLRWNGQREEIVMSLGVLGGSKQAAIIMPVPSQADVKLADAKIFDELDELTKPLVQEETEWVFNLGFGAGAMPPEGVGGAPPVTVLSRQSLGPFDVANLSATDATALKAWLDENGFQLDPRIAEILAPYVEKKWTFVAVRVQPEQASQQLKGDLAPLQISFASNELVYPMRSTALADNQQTVNLYVLADHRVEKNISFGPSRVSYANWIEPSALTANSTLAPYVERKYFLTKYIDTVNPSQVNDDFNFTFASQDTPYREVKIRTVKQDLSGLVLLSCLGVMALGLIALVAIGIFALRRRASQPA
jgi:hypothetical protein